MHSRTLNQVLFVQLSFLFVATAVMAQQWTTLSLSEARSNLASASAAGKALFAGGLAGSVYSRAVDVYTYQSAAITDTLQLSEARSALCCAAVGSRILCGGGLIGPSATSSVVDVFDLSGAAITQSTLALSVDRNALGCGATTGGAGNFLYFAGGFRGATNSHTTTVDRYNAATGTIGAVSRGLSQARTALCTLSFGDVIMFVGGLTSTGVSSLVDVYDGSTGVWTLKSLQLARYYHSCVDGGYVVGGFVDATVGDSTDTVERYDTTTGRFVTLVDTRLSQRRGNGAAMGMSVLLNPAIGSSFVLLYGGGATMSTLQSRIDVLPIASGGSGSNSTGASTSAFDRAVSALTGTSSGSVALFAGGWNGGSDFSDQLLRYEPLKSSATPVAFGSLSVAAVALVAAVANTLSATF